MIDRTDLTALAEDDALGLLEDARDLAEVEAMIASGARFAAMVEGARDASLELDPTVRPEHASRDLWQRISAELVSGPAPRVDQLYEIAVEARGGSPTGRPTGPIVGEGFAKAPH